ncbi:hypothetical protein [Viscerimonas tarda]
MKEQEEDKLRGLFNDIKLDEPSAGLEDRLMRQIQQLASEQHKRKEARTAVLMWFAAALGILAMIVIPATILHLWGWEINWLSELKLPRWEMNISPLFVLISASTLFLLIGDLLIRKHIWEKRK